MSITNINYKTNKIANVIEKHSDIKINRSQFLSHLYYLNKLVYNLYQIYNLKIAKKEKIEKLYNLRDPNGKRFLSRKEAALILKIYGPKISKLYKKLYSLRKKAHMSRNQKGGNITSHPKYQQYKGKINKITNKVEDLSKFYLGKYNKFKDRIPFEELKLALEKGKEISTVIFNWIFFPLWSLENLPLLGPFVEIPLDIMGIIIDNSDIFLEFAAPFIPIIMDVVLDVAQAVPGYGTAASAVALPLNFAEGPIEYLVENGADILGLYINIARKQWGLAYVSALEVIPNLTSFVDAFVTNLSTANKWLGKANKTTDMLVTNLEYASTTLDMVIDSVIIYQPMVQDVISNPKKLVDPYFVTKDILLTSLDKIIIPRKDKFKFLKNVPLEQISQEVHKNLPNIQKIMQNYSSYQNNPDLLYNDLILPIKSKIPMLQQIPDSELKPIISKTMPALNNLTKDPLYYIGNYDRMIDDFVIPFKNFVPILKDKNPEEIKGVILGTANPHLRNINRMSSGFINKLA